MSAPVGADIESICGKCGDVWHVVVAKVGETIVKVQCKQCGRQHRHRPPPGAAGPVRSPGPRRLGQPRPTALPPPRAPVSGPPLVAPDLTREVRPYRPGDSFEPGERIAHPTFGAGVVEHIPGPGKMQVYFPSGRRVLAQARPAATLEAPARRLLDAADPDVE